MKVPDSGMLEETYWESLFDIPLILDRLKIDRTVEHVAELGCGYGTFSLPVVRRIQGVLFTFDIERAMVDRTLSSAGDEGVRNINGTRRDVLAAGFGLESGCCDVVLLFNILHFPGPQDLMAEAARIIRPGGRVLVIHWRSEIPTPRGPAMEVRPRYIQVCDWATEARLVAGSALHLPPCHYGVVLTKRAQQKANITRADGADFAQSTFSGFAATEALLIAPAALDATRWFSDLPLPHCSSRSPRRWRGPSP